MARRQPDIRTLAKRQRWILWLFLAGVGMQLVFPLLPMFSRGGGVTWAFVIFCGVALMLLGMAVLMIVAVVLLLTAQGNHIAMTIVCGILTVVPCAGMLMLLLINMSVTRTLRRAGLRVGFMGVKDEDVERILDPTLCTGCAYNLTGNQSGVCPECGRPIDPPTTVTC